MTTPPTHGLAPEIISMIHGEIESALAALKNMVSSEDANRIVAAIVLLEEVRPEFTGAGRRPWRAVPWLDCAIQLLQQSGSVGSNGAREHVSAARDLLQRD